MLVNAERGEVLLTIEDVELVLAAEMRGLAALSSRLRCQSLADLWGRLTAMEVEAVLAGVECLAIRGDVAKALQALKVKHFKACQTAFIHALNYQMGEEGEGGNGAAAGDATKASHGGDGSSSPSEP
ncbi:MAG TPA: hypothetical protein VNQ99_08700 [Xanthobacteraceae bacterium]|nr:hypothetical protein [Xanthobacteraceae bacterium]